MHFGADDESKVRSIIESISRKFHSHAYPVSRNEALEMGLSVNKKRDTDLEKLLWALWLDIERELKEREPWHRSFELLNNKETADKLLADVPQLDLPPNAAEPNATASVDDIKNAAVTKIKPIDFRTIEAIMESPRQADMCVREGKILASRLPSLSIQSSEWTAFRGWRRVEVGKGVK